MNFEWKKLAGRGQYEIGFIDVYKLIYRKKAIAIIYYLPQHSDKQQRVILTLILEGEKLNWTDGDLNGIFEDAENTIKNAEYFKFNNFNSLEYMDTQLFTIKSIEDFQLLNYGDFSFEIG
ncbi:MAG TPA: hypothetical protein VG367_01620 [Mucilaginibacter sp.]|jgi:hypothetical protein|nr:hypothetical protein [Mucilaginibacter sp.]